MDKKVGEKKAPDVKTKEYVNVTFRENRKFDLHIGRDMVTFLARETKKIPKEWLSHPDFKQAAKRFIVKGV